MAEPALTTNLANPLALGAFALVIPIVLLYLLKPKPKIIAFPSNMFIQIIEKNKRFTSFLQRFIHDPLLVMQILIIALLAATLAAPYYLSETELREEESVVFVIDASASMQATDVAPNRFSLAILQAQTIATELNFEDDVSVVLAANIPAAVTSGATPEQAYATLDRLSVTDTPSNIGDAIMLAKDMIAGSDRKKVIYVLSDFAGSGGLDPKIAKKMAQVQGINVQMLKVGDSSNNAGIVSLDARRSVGSQKELFLTATVRNYMDEEYTASLMVVSESDVLGEQEKTVEAGGEAFFYIRPNITDYEHTIKAELRGDDDLSVDDIAYAYVRPVKVDKVLLLTSEGSDQFLRHMLNSLKNVEPSYAVPPVTPDISKYDVIILGNVKSENILPGMFRDIRANVESGASLVVVGSERLQYIKDNDLWAIMPVDMVGPSSRETEVRVVEEHDMLADVIFDSVMANKYYAVKPRDNETKTLVGSSVFDNPMIAYRQTKKGYVAYMGINSDPEWSNLYYSSSFPIFWSQMLKYFTQASREDKDTTLKTGEYLQLSQPAPIKTPSEKSITASSLFLDKVGVYSVSHPDHTEKIAVNLMDPAESNITGIVGELRDAAGYSVKRETVDVRVELFRHILILMLAALVIELIIYRRRGLL